MKYHKYRIIICLFVLVLFSGCATAVLIGGAAIGAGTGTYFWVNEELKTDDFASFDQVWSACEKTVADMHGTEVHPVKEIAQGKITAIINGEKVKFDITYRSKNQTSVGIRVGLVGNKMSSQLLHDKIAENLSKS